MPSSSSARDSCDSSPGPAFLKANGSVNRTAPSKQAHHGLITGKQTRRRPRKGSIGQCLAVSCELPTRRPEVVVCLPRHQSSESSYHQYVVNALRFAQKSSFNRLIFKPASTRSTLDYPWRYGASTPLRQVGPAGRHASRKGVRQIKNVSQSNQQLFAWSHPAVSPKSRTPLPQEAQL